MIPFSKHFYSYNVQHNIFKLVWEHRKVARTFDHIQVARTYTMYIY